MPMRVKIAFVSILLFLLPACSHQRAVEALRLLNDVAAAGGPSELKERTTLPHRETLQYEFEGASYTADIYRPSGGPAKAVTILVPGVVEQGKDDPRLVAFANSMARSQFLVFVPDLTDLKQLKASSKDAVDLSKAVRYAASLTGVGDQRSIGVMAFSYSAGPALIAALSEETRHIVRFVFAVGPYYSLTTVTTFLTTGHYRKKDGGRWHTANVSDYAKWTFAHGNASRLSDPEDRRLLTQLTRRKLDDPTANVDNLAGMLGPEGRAVYELLTNTDPSRTPGLIQRLPPSVLSELRALDLENKNLQNLEAQLILIHGRDDTLIPYTESLALTSAVGRKRANSFIINDLEHVELDLRSVRDLYNLWQATYLLLQERDDMPAPEKTDICMSQGVC